MNVTFSKSCEGHFLLEGWGEQRNFFHYGIKGKLKKRLRQFKNESFSLTQHQNPHPQNLKVPAYSHQTGLMDGQLVASGYRTFIW
jgi:hypothetical protein